MSEEESEGADVSVRLKFQHTPRLWHNYIQELVLQATRNNVVIFSCRQLRLEVKDFRMRQSC